LSGNAFHKQRSVEGEKHFVIPMKAARETIHLGGRKIGG